MNELSRSASLGCLLGAALLTACGSGASQPEDEPVAESAGGEDGSGTGGEPGDHVHASAIELIGINPPEVPWSEMGREDRELDMISRFHPIFREVFSNHDPEAFGDFGCESCHGDDMRDRDFAMPNPHLPPVPLAGTPEYEALRAEQADMMRFMEEEVTPHMQTMLGMGATFTCNGCHPTP